MSERTAVPSSRPATMSRCVASPTRTSAARTWGWP